MSVQFASPTVNPRLGSSLAIFASTYTCLVLVLLIFEQLGLPARTLDRVLVGLPLVFYITIAFITRSSGLEDFFLSGQRVPPFYNALAICGLVFGGTLFLGGIGSIFFLGLDAVVLPLGCFAGVILTAFLLIPAIRKAGAYTLPGFLYLRFGRGSLRFTAGLIAIVPCLAILAAEMHLGVRLLSLGLPDAPDFGLGVSPDAAFSVCVALGIVVPVTFGGMRSATWMQSAQFIVFLGVLAPLTAVSVIRTNLPMPQLTYGSQLEEIRSFEATKGLVTVARPQSPSSVLPQPGPSALERPVERTMSALTATDFSFLLVCLAMGVVSQPAIFARASTTPTVPSSRRAYGWAGVTAAFIALTIPAYAIFTKAVAVEGLLGIPLVDMPPWSKTLQQLGLLSLQENVFDGAQGLPRVLFERDTVALLLPVAGGLPRVFFGLVMASALAALLASATGNLAALANIVSDDLYGGTFHRSASPRRRVTVARFALIGFGASAAVLAYSLKPDALRWVLYAFSLSAGSFFPVLVLSVWWKGLSAPGALIGILTGFAVTSLPIYFGALPFGVDVLTAAVVGVPASLAAAFLVSMMTRTDTYAEDAAEEIRIPAGETLQSRIQRLSARVKPQRGT